MEKKVSRTVGSTWMEMKEKKLSEAENILNGGAMSDKMPYVQESQNPRFWTQSNLNFTIRNEFHFGI
jgi:hypothetical protein